MDCAVEKEWHTLFHGLIWHSYSNLFRHNCLPREADVDVH